MKLNGWQRLWVLFSVLWLIVVMGFTVATLPKESQILDRWAYATLEKIRDSDESLKKYSMWDLEKAYADIPREELIEKAQAKYSSSEKGLKIDFERINKRYKNQLGELTTNQAKSAGLGVAVWLGTILVVYILGWSVGWVIRGFKPK